MGHPTVFSGRPREGGTGGRRRRQALPLARPVIGAALKSHGPRGATERPAALARMHERSTATGGSARLLAQLTLAQVIRPAEPEVDDGPGRMDAGRFS